MKNNIIVIAVVAYCIVCTALILLSFQSGDKRKFKVESQVKAAIALADTAILPDTTLAKIDTLYMKEQELKRLNEASKNSLYSERIETSMMKQNSSTLEDITQKEKDKPDPPIQFKTNAPAYPDSIKIVIEPRKRGLFRRRN